METIKDADRKVGVYVRVSSDEQALHGQSLDEQESTLKHYCEAMDWKIVDIYREDGKSGKDLERPAYKRMMQDARAGQINTILIKKIDRLTRSLLDFERILIEYENLGLDVISKEERFETRNPLSAAFIRIIMVFAQLEREQIAKRTADVVHYKRSQGLPTGGTPPLGYNHQKINGKGGPLRLVPEEAELVQEIFRIYLRESSLEKTASLLNEMGLRTKSWMTREGKPKGSKKWSKNHISRLLSNPTYIGKIKGRKGELFAGQHEPIIDEVTFERVKTMLGDNQRNRNAGRSPDERIYLLKGLLKCGQCDRAMTPSFANGRFQEFRYYRCGNDVDRSRKTCLIKSVNADDIETAVVKQIRDLAANPSLLEMTVEKTLEELRVLSEPQKKMLETLRRELEQNQRKIDGIVSTMADLDMQGRKERLRSLADALKECEIRKDQLQAELIVAERKLIELESQEVSTERFRSNFRLFGRVWDSFRPEEKYDLIHLFVKEIVYHSDEVAPRGKKKQSGRIDLYLWNIPELDPEQKESAANTRFAARNIWLHRRDSNPRPIG